MEPIVSPWLIYVIMQAGNFVRGCFLTSLGLFFFTLVLSVSREKLAIKWAIPMVIFFLIALVIPTKNTIIAMIAAKHITRDNISQGVGIANRVKEDIKTDIIDIIEALSADNNKP